MDNYEKNEAPENQENFTLDLNELPPDKPKLNWKKELWEWTQSLLVALVVIFLVRTFLFIFVLVEGASMDTTLATGDRLYVSRFMYTPKNGDIIVFEPEGYNKQFIKRVIAVPGQTLDIDFENAHVIVDGVILQEDYISTPTFKTGDVKYPLTVPDGYFFAMGDNREWSHDCRSTDVGDNEMNGLVSSKRAMGKALFRIWPFSKFGWLY